MDCDIDFEVLMAYLDGELAPIERGRVAEHIVACEACRNTVNDLRAVSGALTKWVVPEPVGLPTARELLDRAGAARPIVVARPVWRGVVLRWAAAAALAVVAVTIAAVVLNRSSDRGYDTASAPSQAQRSAPPPAAAENRPASPTPAGGGAGAAANANTSRTETPGAAPAEPAPSVESQDKAGTSDGVVANEAKKDESTDDISRDGFARSEEPAAPGADAPKPSPVQAPTAAAPAPPPPPPMRAAEAPRDAKERDAAPSSGGAAASESAAGRRKQLSIKSDVLTIETRDVDAAVSAVSSAAKSSGGSVASRGSTARRDGGRTVTLTVSVPVDRYEALVSRIKGVGTLKGEVRSSRDVDEAIDQLDDREDADRQREKMVEQTKTATIRVTIQEP